MVVKNRSTDAMVAMHRRSLLLTITCGWAGGGWNIHFAVVFLISDCNKCCFLDIFVKKWLRLLFGTWGQPQIQQEIWELALAKDTKSSNGRRYNHIFTPAHLIWFINHEGKNHEKGYHPHKYHSSSWKSISFTHCASFDMNSVRRTSQSPNKHVFRKTCLVFTPKQVVNFLVHEKINHFLGPLKIE